MSKCASDEHIGSVHHWPHNVVALFTNGLAAA